MPSPRRLLLAFLLAALCPGCVYYNTFYNARKRYDEAERQRSLAVADPENASLRRTFQDLYLAAIQKASSVLELHPTSGWVDDSLLLIGKAYYWREEYGEAVQKFQELEANFPESPLVPEARYWHALSVRGRGDTSDAREMLTGASRSESPFAWHAGLALSELDADEGRLDTAIETFTALLQGVSDGRLRARVHKDLGDAYFGLGRLEEALSAYGRVLQAGADAPVEFETRTRIGQIQEARRDYAAATRAYDEIEGLGRLRLYQPQVRLRKANLLRAQGDIGGAKASLQKIAESFERTEVGAEALYQLGLIEYHDRADIDAAMELLSRARRERPGSDGANRAQVLENTLYQLKRDLGRVEKGGDGSVQALFAVADLYLFNLGQTDSALSAYEKVLSSTDSAAFVPKALYALGCIHADSLGHRSRADSCFRRLIDQYPVTEHAIAARRRVEAHLDDDAGAEILFLRAEALRQEGAPAEDVVAVLQQIPQDYPRSLYAPQALFAAAWTYENELSRLDLAADRYRDLTVRYPHTRYAGIAQEKLMGGFLDPKAEEAPEGGRNGRAPAPPPEAAPPAALAPADSTTSLPAAAHPTVSPPPPSGGPPPPSGGPPPSASPDGPMEASAADRPPRPTYTPEPPPRGELLEEDVDPVVTVRVLVGTDGHVKRAEVVSGAPLLHDDAYQTAFEYRFEPGQHQGRPREVWVSLEIRFTTPAGAR